MGRLRTRTFQVGAAAAAAGAAAASYMAFEAQWPACREADLAVPGLPSSWSGLKVLHLSDNYVGAAGALSLAAALRQEPVAGRAQGVLWKKGVERARR